MKPRCWGIHLTEGKHPFCSPWEDCGAPCPTRRMPASTQRKGRAIPGPTRRDQMAVAHGDMGHNKRFAASPIVS